MSIPYVAEKDGQKVLYVKDEPFFMISGELHNSSSSTAEYMAGLWPKLKGMHLNSVLAPMTWQMVEPVEGRFDFGVLDAIVEQAREQGMKLGILWFGAWKNANCQYAPDWVKQDTKRFVRSEAVKGKPYNEMDFFWDHHMPYTTLSALCEATRQADAKAFAKMMAHIRDIDAEANTIITVQVENETGLLSAPRENSDLADSLFNGPVPERLMAYLANCTELKITFNKEGKTWPEVFGEDAEEAFQAWNTGSYVNAVAEAGKKEYPLPMSANAWLAQGGKPGQYPSGGPVEHVMEIWRAAAPALDVFAPDIYIPQYWETCRDYTRLGNPLYIPEVAADARVAARELYAIGHHHAMCYSPFGIEDLGAPVDTSLGEAVGMDTSDPALLFSSNTKQYARINELLGEMMPRITAAYGTKDLQASFSENPIPLDFGDVRFEAEFGENGACLILREGEYYYVLGMKARVRMYSQKEDAPYIEFLTLEEGDFDRDPDTWHRVRILNGDEEHLDLKENTLLRTKFHFYG